jgi:protocatechuate 3,4-dioxygenase, alpha subunit
MLQTPSQTVGPFFAYGLTPEQYNYSFKQMVDNQLVDPVENQDCITISGQVFDGNNDLIPDAIIEIWDAQNKRFGRFGTGTEKDNRFVFYTTKPKSIAGEIPFLSVIILMRGQLIQSYTRIYFDDDGYQNDAILDSLSPERRQTLIAQKKGLNYEFNIKMQGENETVFFDI